MCPSRARPDVFQLHPAGCSLLHGIGVFKQEKALEVSIAPCRVLAVARDLCDRSGWLDRWFQLHPAGCSLLHDSLTKQRLAASNVSIAPCRVLAVALSAMA